MDVALLASICKTVRLRAIFVGEIGLRNATRGTIIGKKGYQVAAIGYK
jgi:hypothetical protein